MEISCTSRLTKRQPSKDVSMHHHDSVSLDQELKKNAPITLSTFVANAMKKLEDEEKRL
jgi:hypothetical protein